MGSSGAGHPTDQEARPLTSRGVVGRAPARTPPAPTRRAMTEGPSHVRAKSNAAAARLTAEHGQGFRAAVV